MLQLTLWSIPPMAAAIISLIAFRRASDTAHVPGGQALRFLFLMIFLWSGPQTLETFFVQESAKLFLSQLSYVGIALTPVAWFQFALTYSQRVLKMPAMLMYSISIVPVITLCLALTNTYHHLLWSNWYLVNNDGYVGLVTEHEFWFYVHAFYSYGLILCATAILTFALSQFHLQARSLLTAITAPLVGVLANLYYLSPFNPAPWLDFTTLGFLAGILLLYRYILQEDLLKCIPVVRDRVMEQLTDPIFVISHEGNIIDANQSALQAFADMEQPVLHTHINTVAEHLYLESIRNLDENSEVAIGLRSYEVASTQLDSTNKQSDVALVFRDVTERRLAEQKLRKLKDELERMAHTDVLTSLFNRRYFMQRLSEEFERVNRHGNALSVLIFDLDHFKNINDTFGHDIGDHVLESVATVTRQIKRIADVACRLGGEEFALLLPETDKAGAIKVAQRLRQGIEEFPYAKCTGKDVNVTASFGVAAVGRRMHEPNIILQVADRALYKAKNGGRNRICSTEE